jgi:Spy/CpxP family protein refolding chaperone
MNKKILISFGTVAVLAASVFAYQGQGMPPQGGMPPQSGCHPMHPMNCNQHQKMRMHHHPDRFFATLRSVHLTQEQRDKIRTIFRENMKNMPNPMSAFSAKGFDKARFIKLAQQMREEKLKRKADMMEKVFNTLTPLQKKEFAKRINERPMMGKQGFQPRNYNGQQQQ